MRMASSYNGTTSGARPMTSVRAAGFSRAGGNGTNFLNSNSVFDPLNQAASKFIAIKKLDYNLIFKL